MKINKMASTAIMIGGVLINATASVGGSHLAVERHELTVEKYQAAYEKYQENRTKLLVWIATYDGVKEQAKQNFVDTEYALKLYKQVHYQDLDLRATAFRLLQAKCSTKAR